MNPQKLPEQVKDLFYDYYVCTSYKSKCSLVVYRGNLYLFAANVHDVVCCPLSSVPQRTKKLPFNHNSSIEISENKYICVIVDYTAHSDSVFIDVFCYDAVSQTFEPMHSRVVAYEPNSDIIEYIQIH